MNFSYFGTMRKTHALGILVMLLLAGFHGWAQKPDPPKTTSVAKFKPPVVTTKLGRTVSPQANVSLLELPDLVQVPLRAWDAKGNPYRIVYYQVIYTRKVVTEDESTGEAKPSMDMISSDFTQTPLPPRWIQAITASPKKGEKLHFFDVMAVDDKGRRFMAPDLLLTFE